MGCRTFACFAGASRVVDGFLQRSVSPVWTTGDCSDNVSSHKEICGPAPCWQLTSGQEVARGVTGWSVGLCDRGLNKLKMKNYAQ